MNVRFTNRQIAEATGSSFPQVRRWVVAFLPPDPKIGQHAGAGIKREHSINETFQVILGGKLIFQHRMTIRDAREASAEIIRLLRERGWMPEDLFEHRDKKAWIPTILRFGKTHKDQFHYILREIVFRGKEDNPEWGKLTVEKYRDTVFGDRSGWNRSPGEILLNTLVKDFCDDLTDYLADSAGKN